MLTDYTVRYAEEPPTAAQVVTASHAYLAADRYARQHRPTLQPREIVVTSATAPRAWVYEVRSNPVVRLARRVPLSHVGRAEPVDEQLAGAPHPDPLPEGEGAGLVAGGVEVRHEAAILAALADGPLTWRELVRAAHLMPALCSAAWTRLEARGAVEVRDGKRALVGVSRGQLRQVRNLRLLSGWDRRLVKATAQGPATATELCDQCGVSAAWFSGAVARLIEGGWIQRADDGRYELAMPVYEGSD